MRTRLNPPTSKWQNMSRRNVLFEFLKKTCLIKIAITNRNVRPGIKAELNMNITYFSTDLFENIKKSKDERSTLNCTVYCVILPYIAVLDRFKSFNTRLYDFFISGNSEAEKAST